MEIKGTTNWQERIRNFFFFLPSSVCQIFTSPELVVLYEIVESQIGVVIKALGQKPADMEFYSFLRHKANWITLSQTLSLTPRKETTANHIKKTLPRKPQLPDVNTDSKA